jgi:UDP-GlcNAc:undecaprenyl-phosphate GlcNAc-1-phosphate transferase
MSTFITFSTILISGLLAFLFSLPGLWLARKLGLVDIPNRAPHKKHLTVIPLAGGTVLLASVILACTLQGTLLVFPIGAVLLPAGIVYLFGLWDDWKDLAPRWKMLGQVIASVLMIVLGVQVRLFTQDWLNYLVTVVWMVGITNSFNFVDSMDGLALGLGGVAAAFFMFVTIESQQDQLSLFSMILVGVSLGTFYYNSKPAYFFLGDSGAQFIGFVLAAVGIAYNPLGYSRLASWYVPILLLGIPIFDTTLVVFSRLRRKKPIYQGALDHTYHRLVARGIDPIRAVLTMHMAAIILGCLAFVSLPQLPLVANGIFGGVLVIGAAIIFYLDYQYGIAKQ